MPELFYILKRFEVYRGVQGADGLDTVRTRKNERGGQLQMTFFISRPSFLLAPTSDT